MILQDIQVDPEKTCKSCLTLIMLPQSQRISGAQR
jgi:hypothetical protein